MTEQSAGPPRTEIEPPPFGAPFIVLMLVLAIATLFLHVALTMVAVNVWTRHFGSPSAASPMRVVRPSSMVLPGNSVVFENELWVTVGAGVPQPRIQVLTRPPTSRLVAINLKTADPRETGITLSPSPLGLFVHRDKLWAVAENCVVTVQSDNATTRYPKRLLNSPTKPFLYQDQLAVIDKGKNDICALLTWNDGEWNEVGKVDVPLSSGASPWIIDELRVISHGDTHYLFYFNGATISYREGIPFISNSEPASALFPQNRIMNMPNALAQQYQGWTSTPLTTTWGATWDLAIINGELYAFCLVAGQGSTKIQQRNLRNGAWLPATDLFADVSSFSVDGGREGLLVDNDLNLYAIDGSTAPKSKGISLPLTEYTRAVFEILMWLGPYLVATAVLVIGTSRLMRRYRRSEYLYGKRTATQAAVWRRALARAVDTILTVFPPAFWIIVMVTNRSNSQMRYNLFGTTTEAPLLSFSIFGMWLGGILILSFMEGVYGTTPGKWLCGILTMRTTLRPCGMIRALAREFLVYADSILLLTWLPGVLVIAFTKDWQRIGDLASDTVVIDAPVKSQRKSEDD